MREADVPIGEFLKFIPLNVYIYRICICLSQTDTTSGRMVVQVTLPVVRLLSIYIARKPLHMDAVRWLGRSSSVRPGAITLHEPNQRLFLAVTAGLSLHKLHRHTVSRTESVRLSLNRLLSFYWHLVR